MQNLIQSETLPRLERIRYVTENFGAMTGLSSVWMGFVFLAPPLQRIYGRLPLALDWMLLLAFFPCIRYIPRYYERRFGWVEPKSPSNRTALAFVAILILLVFFGRNLEALLSHVNVPFTLGFGLIGLVIWARRLRNIFRYPNPMDLPGAYFFSFGTFAYVVLLLYATTQTAQVFSWKGWDELSLGASWIAIGLFDHITLIRLLPKRNPNEAESA